METSSAQPNVRDHREGRRPPRDRYDGPRDAPPPLRVEKREAARAGFVWIDGHWDWRGGRWEWVSGRWERERARKKWRATRWESRGGVYVRVDGDWIDDDRPVVVVRPRTAPPPLREERIVVKAGHVWVRGHWDWQNGQYVWVSGRYEPVRTGRRWREARWEQRGGEWIRIDGDWEEIPMYPTAAPPPLREERIAARAGFVWVRGRWEWRNGNWEWTDGRWERVRAKQRWTDGRWEQRGGRWEWVDGSWENEVAAPPPPPAYGGRGPRQAPPPLRTEDSGPARAGFIWVRGHWDWKDGGGGYQWVAGHWERQRARMTWADPRWELQGDVWIFIPGGWR